MTTKITSDNLAPALVATIEAGAGPKISNVLVANASYTVLDDTAVSLDGGYIIINGTGFQSNVNILIDGTAATSVTRISETEIRAQVPALAAGSKVIYLTNTDTGSTAIRLNGLTYSGTPTWITGSTLEEGLVDTAISIQLSANSDSNVSYQVQSGSSLPAGLTLAANGLLTGTVTGIENETLYNFTVEAIDAENQESPRSFSITITVGDEYFYATSLLLNGDGTNGAQNNTFLDSSTNNFTITRNGNTTQGTFSPFSQDDGKWSNFLNGGYSYLTNSTGLGSNNFTIEFWGFDISGSSNYGIFSIGGTAGADFAGVTMASGGGLYISTTGSSWTYSNVGGLTLSTDGQWHHYAIVRNGGSLLTFKDGALIATVSISGTIVNNSGQWRFGAKSDQSGSTTGYISNFRVVNGTAVYTSAFTVPSTPLAAIANTAVLVCQGNRFKDSSANAFAVTVSGSPSIQPFSPFAPSAAYSAATNGGSGYFDGSGDYLTAPNNSATDLGSADFTVEAWIYTNSANAYQGIIQKYYGPSNYNGWAFRFDNTGKIQFYCGDGSSSEFTVTGTSTCNNNAWHHVAAVRSGSTIAIYVDGVRENTGTCSFTISSTSSVYIGQHFNGAYVYTGYITALRVVKGSAVYSGTTYTVPTSPPTAITNTSLLLNFTNAGIQDLTGRNDLETVGNAQISTSVKKFGTGSILLTPGNSSYYTRMPLTEQLKFGTGDFTIECWIYLITNAAGICAIWSNYSSFGAGSLSLFAGHSSASTNHFNIAHNGGFPALASTTTVNSVLNTWTHLAVVRYNSQIKLYVNGVSEGTPFSSTAALNGVGSYFWVGTTGDSTTGNPNCYIDDFRITKGVARYTSNFTPPTSAHRLR